MFKKTMLLSIMVSVLAINAIEANCKNGVCLRRVHTNNASASQAAKYKRAQELANKIKLAKLAMQNKTTK